MNYERSGRVSPHPQLGGDQDGMSLVEVLVAILLLGIILSAAASSMIQFARTAADNERRVQSTALMNRLQEELQALTWTDSVVYEDDLTALLAVYGEETEGVAWSGSSDLEGLTYDGANWWFEGEEVVLLPGPGTDGRRSTVPDVREGSVLVDGRAYEVIRFITWNDRDPQIKRFTTIVRWRLYDRVYEERFFSLRAATGNEAGDPERPRVVQFHVGPSPMDLVDVDETQPAQNAEDIQILVRFSEGVSSATLRYQSVLVTPSEDPMVTEPDLSLVERSLTLTPYITDSSGNYVGFYGTIGAGTRTFPVGTWSFAVQGELAGETFDGRTAMKFVGGTIQPEDVGLPPEDGGGDGSGDELTEDWYLGPIIIDYLTFTPTTVCTDENGDFVEDVTITSFIRGLESGNAVVSIAYTAGGVPRGELMPPVSTDTFGPDGATFRLILAAGSDHGFLPELTSGGSEQQRRDETAFTVSASRTVGDGAAALDTAPTVLTVLGHKNNSCK